MEHFTMLTLRLGSATKSFSFDPEVQSVLWLGLAARTDPQRALLCVEDGGSHLLLRSVGKARLVVPGRTQAVGGPVAIPWGTTWMLGITGVDVSEAGLYVRPLSVGAARFVLRSCDNLVLGIGRSPECDLRYDHAFVSNEHAKFSCQDGVFGVQDQRSTHGTTVNGMVLAGLQPRTLAAGDVVQIADLVILVGKGLLFMNQPPGLADAMPGALREVPCAEVQPASLGISPDVEQERAFYPAPRLSQAMRTVSLRVEEPPARPDGAEQPVLMQVGPSFLMGMTSIFMGANAIAGLMSGAGMLSTLPSLSMAVAMLGGTIVWPLMSHAFERRQRHAHEMRRARLYAAYLDHVENDLADAARAQTAVFAERLLPTQTLLRRAQELSPLLMSHERSHEDFLDLRVGVGDADLDANVEWPRRGIALTADDLWERVEWLEQHPPRLLNVPLSCNLADHAVVGVLGTKRMAWEFVRGLLVQICARYSYTEVKVVLIADEDARSQWEFVSSLRHAHDDVGRQRFVATTLAGLERIDRALVQVLEARRDQTYPTRESSAAHYVIACGSMELAKQSRIVDRLTRHDERVGFSVICMGEHLSDLPRGCGYLIDLDVRVERGLGRMLVDANPEHSTGRQARMFSRADVTGAFVAFDPDILVTAEQARSFGLALSRARLESADAAQAMPDMLGFLELYGAGNVQHLNIGQRWAQHDASRSLRALVGVDTRGQAWSLDLHEQAHGPHGLVAGTTGSGKSEFLVTCLLSLAVDYAPHEVAFLIIDYKGGGLAGAFSGGGHRLPHLVGTITNLDGSEIRRALISVRSELMRRQRLLARAREITGETTMDVYRYQSLFRQGMLDEALPHLVIVADEFAELKQQEPGFMEELMSAARIGRSLGVHLILATQKPAGVVNDQIWANARFKVSLKVADVEDSREMLRRDEAAHLTRPGSFFVLVGYDEAFVGGQAAYAGGRYVPCEHFEPRRDLLVELLDAEGEQVASLQPSPAQGACEGETELGAVLSHIEEVARAQNICPRPLWLDPLPDCLTLEELSDFLPSAEGTGPVCVAGLVDDPEFQRQEPLLVDLRSVGHVLVSAAQAVDAEDVLLAMLASLLRVPYETPTWVYCLDFGDGRLAHLTPFPQVGGVACAGDEERLEHALRLVERELSRRRAQSQANLGQKGQRALVSAPELRTGHALTPTTSLTPLSERPSARGDVPSDKGSHIVLGIANLAGLLELQTGLEERLMSLLRDAASWGVHIIATASGTHALPLRMQACFGATLAMGYADREAYVSLLGGPVEAVPSRHGMRGLVREDKRLLEFQGACLCEHREDTDPCLADWAIELPTNVVAPPIPQLPSRVTAAHMGTLPSPRHVPIGLSRRDVEPSFVSLADERLLFVVGNERSSLDAYLRGLLEVLVTCGTRVRVVDVARTLDGSSGVVEVTAAAIPHTPNANDDSKVSAPHVDVFASAEGLSFLLDELERGSCEWDVMVVAHVAQAMETLDADLARRLAAAIVEAVASDGPALVLTSEAWRVASLYDRWYRLASSQGARLWVGNGFADQSVVHFSRVLPEYRRPTRPDEGFLALGGVVEGIRLVQRREGSRV